MDQDTGQTAASVTAGLLTREALRAEMNWCARTVIRREKDGMPVIKIGALRLYDPASVRAWLMTHERHRETPKRGRPRRGA